MANDELRKRLAQANPVPPSHPVDPVTSDRARAMMEEIMATTMTPPPVQRRTFRPAAAVAAAALAVMVGGGALLAGLGSAGEPLVLTGEAGDPTAICLPFDPATLGGMSPAFAGTVVKITDSVVTLEVTRWFAGGDASVVEVEYTPGFEALIGTPAFAVGQSYLITAANGVVNGCGYSGLATPEYLAAFEQAFGA
jgi:hypothetical protein